ncbi:MAG: RdgB/HAM1 family non-canonical purine NTP pyrophosphatase [Kiritimatiellae bacterium]|nr:RdgB/HAM1 family non-canonical purine NTP pyrophosphatase [Kiritimatiellia bacterium]
MKLYVATHNQHKLREIAEILPEFEIVADDPAGAEETSSEFIGNAFIKVRAIASKHPGEWCMADDSGLEVAALGGAPGVRSARYAGGDGDTPANNALLLKNLEGIEDRKANFTCAIALIDPDGREHSAIGKSFGRIAEKASGIEGFGYDPLFIPDGYFRSFAELSAGEKNAISHRGRALEKARGIIRSVKKPSLKSWLRLFRFVNIPTVPGDILVGAAAAVTALGDGIYSPVKLAAAAAASVFFYLFGLVDNDIVGAKTDENRPIADGEISLAAARVARGLFWAAAVALGYCFELPHPWWIVSFALLCSIIVYNRTKRSLVMGLCRALNVLSGAVVFLSGFEVQGARLFIFVGIVSFIWLLYVSYLTYYASDENRYPSKKPFVRLLIAMIVYLQLLALIVFAVSFPPSTPIRHMLFAGAGLLITLRVFKFLMRDVSAT